MSYKKKKMKKGFLNQLKRMAGLVKIALLKKSISLKKPQLNMQQQTRIIMNKLRDTAKTVRQNNLKISEWVDTYVEDCILNGKRVEILTQYCLSKDLEKRYEVQGNSFVPLKAEQQMFFESIPVVIEMFKTNGVQVNWYVTFNNSFLDRGRVSEKIVNEYISMIQALVQSPEVILLNWEQDILGKRPEPNKEVLDNFDSLVSKQAFDLDMGNLLSRVRQYKNFTKSEEELTEEAKFKIACEAEEGRFIFSKESPFSQGNVLIVPLEFPERLVFFETITPGFQKRIVPILKLYPWRMDAESLIYSKNGGD